MHVTVNGVSGTKIFYLNGKDVWTGSEIASGVVDLINNLDCGVTAKISEDDSTVAILYATAVGGPIEITTSIQLGQTYHQGGTYINELEDNGSDDYIASVRLVLRTQA